MKLRRFSGVVLILWMAGCATSPHRQAQSYLAEEAYDKALRSYLEYLKPHLREGRRYIMYDPDIMTGIGEVYWYMGKYNTATRLLRFVIARSPDFGRALFLLGSVYEKTNRHDLAMEIYSRYTALEASDGYREMLKGRLDWMMRKRAAGEIARAIQEEANVSVHTLPEYSIAVLYFYNLTESARWNPLQKGLAEMMISDLSQIENLQVVDRMRIQQLIEVMNLGGAGFVDEQQISRFGKLLGARNLLRGSYMIHPDMALELSAGTADVAAAHVPEMVRFDGVLSQLFQLEKDIVLRTLSDLGIEPSPEQMGRIMRYPTSQFKAFLDYCYGLDALDLGNYELAQHYFELALETDPNLQMARQAQFSVSVFEATHIDDVVQMSQRVTGIITPRSSLPSGMAVSRSRFAANTRSRFQQMSMMMDAGFIPGNDTRQSYEEAAGIMVLDGPPAPPFFPEDWFLPDPPDPPVR